jgi:hypothetical protein
MEDTGNVEIEEARLGNYNEAKIDIFDNWFFEALVTNDSSLKAEEIRNFFDYGFKPEEIFTILQCDRWIEFIRNLNGTLRLAYLNSDEKQSFMMKFSIAYNYNIMEANTR